MQADRPKTTVKIADRLVGNGEPCFIIAEAGVNHNGDVNLARQLIDAANEAGADAVKFQTFTADEVVTRSAAKAAYQQETTSPDESQYDMIRQLELSPESFKELYAYTQQKGIIFMSTPFDKGSVDLLNEIGVPAFKVGSGELTNLSLLRYIAGKRKPIILSTGMSRLEEVAEALDAIGGEGGNSVVLLHCVSSYPAKIEDMNLKVMATLRYAFKLPVGLSDHSPGITVPVAAAAMGACAIEKHFTMDKDLPGPDHRASLEPEELKRMVAAIRDVEKAMGDGVKSPAAVEGENKKVIRRSIVARNDIPEGTIITEDMLAIKRPGTGLEPKYLGEVIKKIAKADINKDEMITWRVLK